MKEVTDFVVYNLILISFQKSIKIFNMWQDISIYTSKNVHKIFRS